MHNPVINMGNGADLDSRSSQDRGLRTKGNRGAGGGGISTVAPRPANTKRSLLMFFLGDPKAESGFPRLDLYLALTRLFF